MPEFRQDLISGQWVIIATERAKRLASITGKTTAEPDRAVKPGYTENCPFCPGNEEKTPSAVLALGRNGGALDKGGWRVRVVPNKFPALKPEEKPPPRREPCEGFFKEMPGYGVHEVIIEAPEHNRHPGELGQEQMELVVTAYYQRCRALASDKNLRFAQLFRNYGRGAGASLEHPHSQIIALPFVPGSITQELARAHEYYLIRESCVYCRLLDEERQCGTRIIVENNTFSAYVPYASRYPFEIWIVPRRHQSSFVEITEAERSGLAGILDEVLRRVARTLDDPPYNYYLKSAPLRAGELPHYHWHLELVPKLTTVAGFEMGSDVFINVMLPEEAARLIRHKGGSDHEAWRKDILYSGLAQPPTGGQSV